MAGQHKQRRSAGFTIIEVSLFLGISGLLFAGLLTGVGLSLQRQRYTDSVNSTHSFLQRQFNEVLNVVNTRPGGKSCAGGVIGNASQPIGASNCLVLGRVIEFAPGGDKTKLRVYTVVGQRLSEVDLLLATDDFDVLGRSDPHIVASADALEYLIPWSAETSEIKRSITGEDEKYVALLRSPRSGATIVYSFAATDDAVSTDPSIKNQMIAANAQKPVTVCIASGDIASSRSAIRFDPLGSQDSVSAKFDVDDMTCDR